MSRRTRGPHRRLRRSAFPRVLPHLLGVCLLALSAPPLSAQARGLLTAGRDLSFGNISILAGGGVSLQRGERPQHSTLGVALGADFLKPRLIGTGQFRAKFLDQEDVRDPTFVCASQDCGPTHRLGLQGDAFFDLFRAGPVGFGVAAGFLAFRGTLSTIVVQHPGFEEGLTAISLGPSVSLRTDAAYVAAAPVWNYKHEETLGGDRFSSTGAGLTGAMGLFFGRFGVYADGRYLVHPRSGSTRSGFGDVYLPPPRVRQTVRVDDAVMADADVRLRFRIASTSYVNVGAYVELSTSDLRFVSTDLVLPRRFRDSGLSLSFEFLQY